MRKREFVITHTAYASRLRGEHRHTADTEHAWLALEDTVAAAIRPESGFLSNC